MPGFIAVFEDFKVLVFIKLLPVLFGKVSVDFFPHRMDCANQYYLVDIAVLGKCGGDKGVFFYITVVETIPGGTVLTFAAGRSIVVCIWFQCTCSEK